MNNGGFKVPGQINSFKVKEINVNDDIQVGQYLDGDSMYTIFPKLQSSLKVQQILDSANEIRPNILGQKSEFFDFFNMRITRQDTKNMKDVKVYVELPEQENYVEIVKLHVANDVTTVGKHKVAFEMTVKSANLTVKNMYGLLDHPDIQFRPIEVLGPDGTNGYRYKFEVIGNYDDYIKVSRLKTGSRFVNNGAFREEAVLNRGSVDMKFGGKAYVCYRYPFTKMGFEVGVTDEAWRAGTHFMVEPTENSSKEFKEYYPKFTFSELDAKFKMEADKVYDRYLMVGKGFPAGESFIVDGATHYKAELGPSFMDFFRAANKEFYYHQSFNPEYIFDRIRRQISKMKLSERSGLVVDVITGDGGWDLLTPHLNRMNTSGLVDPEWLYSRTEGLDKSRQGIILNKPQVRGLHLDNYGTVIFHNNDVLNNGLLSGQRDVRKGYKLSSYWFIIMISHNNDKKQLKNKSMFLYENSAMEGLVPLVGTFTPTGHIANTKVDYKSAGNIGHMYKIIYDLEKAIYVPNIQAMHILYSDIVIRD